MNKPRVIGYNTCISKLKGGYTMTRDEKINRIIELLEQLGIIPPPALPDNPEAGRDDRPAEP